FEGGFELTDATSLLPTRRGVRALGDALLRVAGGRALLLPSISALGDIDEEELVLDHVRDGAAAPALPPAMPAIARPLRLARLIAEEGGADKVRALGLAADLGRFLDMVVTEGADLSQLASLVPQEFADHWQITLDFLHVLTARWPEELARLGYMEQAE